LYPAGTVLTITGNGALFHEWDPEMDSGRGRYRPFSDRPRPKAGDTATLTGRAIQLELRIVFPVTFNGREGMLYSLLYGDKQSAAFSLEGPPLGTAVVKKNERVFNGYDFRLFGGSKTIARLKKGDVVTYYGFSEASDKTTYIYVETADGVKGIMNLDSLDRQAE
jgi:hypothetical protein